MISFIRDYLEILSDAAGSTASSIEIFHVTCQFFITSITKGLAYLVTFGWVRDILYLPIILPQWQDAILSEHFFSEDFHINLFSVLTNSSQNNVISLLILGFLNSFICCLPFSTVHFLSLRRLFVQGVSAGIASILGMIFGQCLFITLIIFGARSLLIPWLNLDPLNYFLGIGFIFIIVYDMANEKRIRPVEMSEQRTLIKIFFISFLLSLLEYATVGQYFGNINFSNEFSLLTLNGIGSFRSNFSYILGLVIGHLFFSGLFLEFTLFIRKGLLRLSGVPYSVWLKQTNFIFLTFIFGFNLSSIPYYGLDYLITKPFGFISQDKTFENSFISGRNLKDPSRLLTSVDASFPLTIDTNISHFDRDNYGEQPKYFKRNFEELNYQGEYAWIVRRDRKPDLYSSGETTKTRMRDLFQAQQSLETSEKPGELNKENQKIKGVEKKQDSFLIQSSQHHSPERQKLKKRFNTVYTETREKDIYLLGDTFSSFPVLTKQQSPTEIALKQKYYTNGIYKALLTIEIDSFLHRQPKNYTLSVEQENQLVKKRYLLNQYYNTIRTYSQIPYYQEFNDLFQGSKSFVDRAYNHQFKGTLHIVRRLFAITLDDTNNQKSVLKYDIPLFKPDQKHENQLIHEELIPQLTNSPFLEFNESTPFYVGWDNQNRQLVLTQRFSHSYDSLSGIGPITNKHEEVLKTEFRKNLIQKPQVSEQSKSTDQVLHFTTWPIENKRLKELKSKRFNRINTLYEPMTNPDMLHVKNAIRSSRNTEPSLPINMKYLGKIADRLAPNHGGIIWPGNQNS